MKLKKWVKSKIDDAGKALKKTMSKVKKVIKKGGAAARKALVTAYTLPIRPFEKAMRHKLQKDGITPASDFVEMLVQFYNKEVKGHHYDQAYYEEHYETYGAGVNRRTERVSHFIPPDPSTVMAIVNTLLPMLKNLVASLKGSKDKKEQELGNQVEQEVTKTEQIIAASQKPDTTPKSGGSMFNVKYIVITIIAVGAVAFLLKPKK